MDTRTFSLRGKSLLGGLDQPGVGRGLPRRSSPPTVAELARDLDLQLRSAPAQARRRATGGHCGDLVSAAMAVAREGDIWITRQVQPHIVPVAALLRLAAIVITDGALPEAATLARAEVEQVPVLTTGLSAYQVAGRLYQLGLR